LTVSLVGNGKGRVTSTPAGIDCPATCTMNVEAGSTVSLSPAPDASSGFIGWGGGCTGPGDCRVTPTVDTTVWTNFELTNPAVNPCDGIAAPDEVPRAQYVVQSGATCLPGLGDAQGTLAFPVSFNPGNTDGGSIDLVTSAETFLRRYAIGAFDPNVLPQPNGFAAATRRPQLGPPNFIGLPRWNSAGDELAAGSHFGDQLAIAANPAGGVLIAGNLSATSDAPPAHVALMVTGGAEDFAVTWGPTPLASAGAVLGAGVDLLGHSLVITDGAARAAGEISGQWFDETGTPLTQEFPLLTGFSRGVSTWFETSPLIGGGLLVRRMDFDGHYHALALVTVASGQPMVAAAPEWMVSRRDVRLEIARDGRAYATLPYGAPNVACTQRVEVLAPDGTSCGSRDYPLAAGTCDTGAMTLGLDGTVIQQLPLSMETPRNPQDGTHTCTWWWWPAALR
jgi:hypothetical protein